ncbi:MAG: hypothetical protein ACI86H_000329 [bacterium]|jgi:hypothetical protein
MHAYIERVRNEIEVSAGQEKYLASALFYRMHKELKYEDHGEIELSKKQDFEEIQNKALNSISTSNNDVDVQEESLAWQVAILRDIAKDFYSRWEDVFEAGFFAEDQFTDGTPCVALEATCQKLNLDPTKIYTELLEVKHTLTHLCISCNTTMDELNQLWKFKKEIKDRAGENAFAMRRVESETQHTIMQKSIARLEKVVTQCMDGAKKLAGAEHLLWANAGTEIKSLIGALKGFLYCEYSKEPELVLDQWLDTVFPRTLEDGEYNSHWNGPLHHTITSRLSMASQCLVLHVIKHENSFEKRDQVMRQFIRESLELEKKRTLLENSRKELLKQQVQK